MMGGARLGFRGRLIAAMIALVTLVSVVIGALLMVYLFEDEKSRALEQLTISERLTEEILQHRTALELSRLNVIVQDFGFLSAIASRNPATLDSALDNHRRRAGADFAVLLDSRGEPMATTLTQPLNLLVRFDLDTARRQGFSRRLAYLGERGYELLMVPVKASGLRAWLVAGFALDQELANAIERLSGSSVVFRARSTDQQPFRIFAGSQGSGHDAEAGLTGDAGGRHFLQNRHYFTRLVDLSDSGEAQIQAALLISREASLRNYYQRALEIALLVAGILLLATLLALLIARHLGRPVLQLADYARAVGDGHTAQPPAISAGGELQQLRDALGDMLIRLQEREAQIRYAATHDDVTGLGNRNALKQEAEEVFRQRQPRTLIGLRLSGLSEINDTLGLEFGDKVLQQLALRLRQELPQAQIIAHTGGGEFLALLPHIPQDRLLSQAEHLHAVIQTPLQVDGTPFSPRLTMVTMALPEDASNTNELRRRLNLTFEQADDKPEQVVRYQPGQDESHLRELKLIADLAGAIRNNGLHMQYQPKLDLATGQLVQVEALVRWMHPELGFVSPEEFIFLAEQSGQIHDLTAHILERVAEDARAWTAQGVDAGVAINLSAKDLTWPRLTDHLARTFAHWHHALARITLEVTESALMEDPEEALATLNKLRALGVTLSVDDFGTGYSSLSQLRQMPVQELKIDKSFVLNLDTEPQDQLIVKSTIDMAHGLGLKVVAEGIENLDAWHLLRAWGCNLGQGFGLSRPVPPTDLPAVRDALAERRQALIHKPTENAS